MNMNILQNKGLDMSRNRHNCHNCHDNEIESGLDFILSHFDSSPFPRTISTKTSERRQISVDSKEEALARFKQANYMDCRFSAYSKHDITGEPNFIFIDIDSTNKHLIDRILEDRLASIEAHPTVLFTGNGYHIYQPIQSACIDKIHELRDSCSYSEPSKEFLRFAEIYLSDNRSDPNHNPSFNSCMVRIPNSINSKNALQVKIVQQWDGKRPDIVLLLGSFYAYLLTKDREQKEIQQKISYSESNLNESIRRKWIEDGLLKIGLNDYRKNTINLILAPYFINILKVSFEEASNIIEKWLDICRTKRPLDFNAKRFVNEALITAAKSHYKPMALKTVKEKNYEVYQMLGGLQ